VYVHPLAEVPERWDDIAFIDWRVA
jgi:hypothetical protein